MKEIFKKINSVKAIASLTSIFALLSLTFIAYASWSEPSSNHADQSLSATLNGSAHFQEKLGGLHLNTNIRKEAIFPLVVGPGAPPDKGLVGIGIKDPKQVLTEKLEVNGIFSLSGNITPNGQSGSPDFILKRVDDLSLDYSNDTAWMTIPRIDIISSSYPGGCLKIFPKCSEDKGWFEKGVISKPNSSSCGGISGKGPPIAYGQELRICEKKF